MTKNHKHDPVKKNGKHFCFKCKKEMIRIETAINEELSNYFILLFTLLLLGLNASFYPTGLFNAVNLCILWIVGAIFINWLVPYKKKWVLKFTEVEGVKK